MGFQPMNHRQDADATEYNSFGHPTSVPPIPPQDCNRRMADIEPSLEIGFVWRACPVPGGIVQASGLGDGLACPSAANWLRSTRPAPPTVLSARSGIGFVLPRHYSGRIHHNLFPKNHLPAGRLKTNWLCFARPAPATVVPVRGELGLFRTIGSRAGDGGSLAGLGPFLSDWDKLSLSGRTGPNGSPLMPGRPEPVSVSTAGGTGSPARPGPCHAGMLATGCPLPATTKPSQL